MQALKKQLRRGIFMLIRYNKTHEKIAMGLLSFNPNEKNLQNLLSTINEYVYVDNFQLFLWKVDEGFIGIIGTKLEKCVLQIQHLSIIPSHRDKGYGKQMVKALTELFPERTLTATNTTRSFIDKCDIPSQQMT